MDLSDAENVTVSDTLPVSFTLTNIGSSQGGCTTFPCNLGMLPAGGSATITIIGTVLQNATGEMVNTASITSTTQVTNTIDDTDTVTTSITTVADVSIVKDVNTFIVNAGEWLTYTLTVENHGPSTAQNVQVMDTLSSGVSFITATLPHLGPNPLVWSLGNLDVGETRNLTVVVQTLATLPDGYLIRNRSRGHVRVARSR